MRRSKLLLLLGIVVVIFMFFIGYLYISDQETSDQETQTLIFSAQQFSEKIEINYNDTTKKAVLNYESLQDGNKVIT